MSHNLQGAASQDFGLPDHRVLALQGRDAIGFAQAQFMNDVSALADAQWQWNGWLSPKGRLIALFALLRRDPHTLWLLLPDADPIALAAKLKRYVFRSNVAFHARDDLVVSGAFAVPVHATGATCAEIDAGVELDLSADGGQRRLRLGGSGAAPNDHELSRWRLFDLQHGLPRLAPGQEEQWTPQQLSLERLKAYSIRKGCYPGQEIVARTHFLGKAKRGLMLLQGAGVGELDEVMEGAAVGVGMQTVRPIGQVICAQGDTGLAVMPLATHGAELTTSDRPCIAVSLLDGLAR